MPKKLPFRYSIPSIILAIIGQPGWGIPRFFGLEWVVNYLGPDFPYGTISLCALAYIGGLLFSDWWPSVNMAWKNCGVLFSVEAMRGLDGSVFRSVPYQGRNFIVVPFSVRNKSKTKSISNVRLLVNIRSAANNLLNAPIQQEFTVELHFDDGATSINPDTSSPTILAHQAVDDYGMSFGSPENPLAPLEAGLRYIGTIKISGVGSKTKRLEIEIEALQYSNPTFIVRQMEFDEENAKF